MLLGLCWSNSYTLKTLMNDLKIALSQIESSNVLKNFAPLPCEFGAFSFWQEWDVHKVGGEIRKVSPCNV
jgi:hypothetical protein